MSDKKVYFNKPQRLTQLIGANTTVIVAGRGSDAFDTLYIGCEKFPYRDTFILSMSGVL